MLNTKDILYVCCSKNNKSKYRKGMKKEIILILLAFLMFQCIQPKYIVKKQSEINLLDLNHATINYIPIADSDLINSKILDSTYCLIESKKYSRLYTYIHFLEGTGINSSEFQLAKTLHLITDKEYNQANQSVQLIEESDYKLLKRLLTIDLKYETARINGGFNYNELLKSYQSVIDSFPNNLPLKKIVAIRLRYLRYNY